MGKTKPVKSLSVVNAESLGRSLLVTTFSQGFTSEWKFKLPEAFKQALDIRLTERVVKQKLVRVLTQGTSFSFKRGDTLYDTSLAYTLPWSDALRVLKFAIRVTAATPETMIPKALYEAKEGRKRIQICLYQPVSGTVCFDLLKVREGALVTFRSFEVSQVEFVRFLQQGLMVDARDEQVILSSLLEEAYPKISVTPMTEKGRHHVRIDDSTAPEEYQLPCGST